MNPISDFLRFLIQKDNEYAGYFLSLLSESYTVKKCFLVYNNNLIYKKATQLRPDIKEEIVEKYRKLLGDKAYYIETDEDYSI